MAGDLQDAGAEGLLDSIRHDEGVEGLRSYFCKLLRNNRKKAIELINEENLNFCSFYVLRNEIAAAGFIRHMNSRNMNSLRILYAISNKNTREMNQLIRNQNAAANEALKWIFCTGCAEDGLSSKYDEIMELSAGLLVKHYRDNSILPVVADMIFSRHRNKQLIHNLVWTFFEARNPGSLMYLANYLSSQDSRDYELALRLLGLTPDIENIKGMNRNRIYYDTCRWIQENSLFLYRTDECLHLTAFPQPYRLSVEAKYLNRPVSPDDGRPLRSITGDEETLLGGFRALDSDSRLQLANFSYMLYNRNVHQWNEWIRFPVQDQLRTLKMATGGRS